MLTEYDPESTYFEVHKMQDFPLSKKEIDLFRILLDDKKAVLPKTTEVLQIEHIASHCGIEVTVIEKLLYSILRRRTPHESREDQSLIPMWSLSDQALVREVVLIMEGEGERYQAITDNYPNIF